MSVRLHGFYASSCSWRVRIALAYKSVAYQSVAVDLRAGAHRSADFATALNPMKQVPALEHNGVVLGQSVAILEYIEETWTSPALLPSDPVARGRVRQLVEVINSGIQPLQNLNTRLKLREDFAGVDTLAMDRWSADWIAAGFTAYEALVGQWGGGFSFGATITLADVCLIPQIANARRYGVDLEPFPRIRAVEHNAAQHPAFATSQPELQPDFPA